MIVFHEGKSPLRGKNLAFSFPESQVLNNVFLPLGLGAKGRYHVVLFNRDTTDYTKLFINKENRIDHTADCIQYFLYGAEHGVVGSVFELRHKKATMTTHKLCVEDSDEVTSFSSPLDKDSGGVIVYIDESGSVVVIPSNPTVSEFMVVD